jgi:hypothetical protein
LIAPAIYSSPFFYEARAQPAISRSVHQHHVERIVRVGSSSRPERAAAPGAGSVKVAGVEVESTIEPPFSVKAVVEV